MNGTVRGWQRFPNLPTLVPELADLDNEELGALVRLRGLALSFGKVLDDEKGKPTDVVMPANMVEPKFLAAQMPRRSEEQIAEVLERLGDAGLLRVSDAEVTFMGLGHENRRAIADARRNADARRRAAKKKKKGAKRTSTPHDVSEESDARQPRDEEPLLSEETEAAKLRTFRRWFADAWRVRFNRAYVWKDKHDDVARELLAEHSRDEIVRTVGVMLRWPQGVFPYAESSGARDIADLKQFWNTFRELPTGAVTRAKEGASVVIDADTQHTINAGECPACGGELTAHPQLKQEDRACPHAKLIVTAIPRRCSNGECRRQWDALEPGPHECGECSRDVGTNRGGT